MKKVVIAVVVIGLVGAGGYGVYHHFFENTADSGERVSSDSADAVYVDKISDITGYGSGNGLIERFGGEVEPQSTLEVKLESDRTVKQCFVKEGDHVKEGQRLFVYETQEDEDKLAQAEIDIEKAQGEIELQEKAIKQYEKQMAEVGADEKLEYTIQIRTSENEIKQQEYAIKSKELEIKNLKETIANATVTAEMAGTVQKINDSTDNSNSYGYYGSGDSSSAYITILSDGDFRVKGTLNEQNRGMFDVGSPMIVYSRVDNTKTWIGEVSEIKTEPEENEENNYYYGGSGSDSSNYPFYVELESSEGLLLGQHVYMEVDSGQNDQKDGLWLEDYYIIQEEGKSYVWYANSKNVIEKHEIQLGDYDEENMKYEVLDGLDEEDYIALPQETVFEGAPVIYNDYSSMGGMDMSGMDMGGMDGGWDDDGTMDMGGMDDGWDDDGTVDDGWDDADTVDGGLEDADWNDEADWEDADQGGEEMVELGGSGEDDPMDEDADTMEPDDGYDEAGAAEEN